MLAPDPTFTWGSDRQQYGVDFEDRCTRQRPVARAHGRQLSGIVDNKSVELPK